MPGRGVPAPLAPPLAPPLDPKYLKTSTFATSSCILTVPLSYLSFTHMYSVFLLLTFIPRLSSAYLQLSSFYSTWSLLSLQITMSSTNIMVHGACCLITSVSVAVTIENNGGLGVGVLCYNHGRLSCMYLSANYICFICVGPNVYNNHQHAKKNIRLDVKVTNICQLISTFMQTTPILSSQHIGNGQYSYVIDETRLYYYLITVFILFIFLENISHP